MEANPKNGFLRAKQALSKHGVLKDQNWSHFGKEEKKREEEEEEEKKRKKVIKQAKVWNLDFWYGN